MTKEEYEKKTMNENCSNCKYGKLKWDDAKLEDNLVYCRRYAPKPIMNNDDIANDMATEWEFPLTMPNDWCGEYAATKR
jgi:hypothetical protein